MQAQESGLLQAVMANVLDALIITNESGIIWFLNPSAQELFGYSEAELLGQSIQVLMDDVDQLQPKGAALFQQGVGKQKGGVFRSIEWLRSEYEERGQNYSLFIVRDTTAVSGDATELYIKQDAQNFLKIFKDTAKKEQEHWELRETKELLESLVRGNPDAILMVDLQGCVVQVNPAFEKLFGWTAAQVVGKKLFIIPDHLKDEFTFLHSRVLAGEHVTGYETVRSTKDGLIDVNLTLSPIRNQDGEVIAISSILRDISKRRNSEVKLANTLKKLADINFALNSSCIVQVLNPNGKFKYVNTKFTEVTGYEKGEVVGCGFKRFLADFQSVGFVRKMWNTLKKGQMWKGEINCRTKENSRCWLDVTIVPVFKENGDPYEYIVIGFDVTDKKEAQEIIRWSEKLSAAGQLAAGLAHEIRNPLTSLRGFVQMMQLGIGDKTEYLHIMIAELDRINDIIEELLLLARPQKVKSYEPKDMRKILRHVVTLLESQALMHDVQIHVEYAPELPQILCDESQLKQAFINILKNAIEASPKGGEVTIRIRPQTRRQVLIRFEDQGPGFSPEQLARLGEPFFTTKEKGNGLGLMITSKIIEEHRGKLRVESQPNQGTTFDVLLPAVS